MSINLEITNRLLKLSKTLEKTSNIIFSRFGITITGYEILKLIQQGCKTTTDLSLQTDASPSAITHITKALEENDYLQRSFDLDDKRIWYFALTENGLKKLKLIESIYQLALSQLYEKYTDDQKTEVFNFLDEVERHLFHAVTEHKSEIIQFTNQLLEKSKEVNG
ncbi:MAG: MarR family transcriptional regulator [Patescibacteria group bacterium]